MVEGLVAVPIPDYAKLVKSSSGNLFSLESFYGKGELLVASSMPKDTPVACITKDLTSGASLRWEDPTVALLDLPSSMLSSVGKTGPYITYNTILYGKSRSYRFCSYRAEYIVALELGSKSVVAYRALTSEGEGVCFWIHPQLRSSESMSRFYLSSYLVCLERGYIGKNFSFFSSTTEVGNIASNKVQLSLGYKLIDKVLIEGTEFNKYSIDKESLLSSIKTYLGNFS